MQFCREMNFLSCRCGVEYEWEKVSLCNRTKLNAAGSGKWKVREEKVADFFGQSHYRAVKVKLVTVL